MIIYFTGTGNSRYLAKLLSEELKDELVDATKLIKENLYPTFNSSSPYVFVAPTYAWRLPRIFKDWIKKCYFSGNKKTYFVLNCGSEIGAAGKYIKELCDEMKLDYRGTSEIIMPENYIAMFSAPSEEETLRIISEAKAELLRIIDKIKNNNFLDEVNVTLVGSLCSSMVNDLFYHFCIGAKKFKVKENCISCGQCVNHCMLNNIRLKDGKPIWGNQCTHCMACICKCPVEAIEYGKHTNGLRRYTCPEE